jgi:hypothetical protein
MSPHMKCLLPLRVVNGFRHPNMGPVSGLVIGFPLQQLIYINTTLKITVTLANKWMSSEVRSYLNRLWH